MRSNIIIRFTCNIIIQKQCIAITRIIDDDINAAMTAIARVNPRYNDEVKSRYSTQNSGSSSLNGPERSWLKANDNTITLGYITGKLPYCNENEDGEMEGYTTADAEDVLSDSDDEDEVEEEEYAFDLDGDDADEDF